MDELIKLLSPSYELIQSNIKEKFIVLSIKSTEEVITCPYCGKNQHEYIPLTKARFRTCQYRRDK